jgi:hypothetical protein
LLIRRYFFHIYQLDRHLVSLKNMMTVLIAKSDNDRARSAAYVSFKNNTYMYVKYALKQIRVLIILFLQNESHDDASCQIANRDLRFV